MKSTSAKSPPKKQKGESSLRFEAASTQSLFAVLDAIAWLELPDIKKISQFAGIDPRTTGKLLKNCLTIELVQMVSGTAYLLSLPYPYKGSEDQKRAVVREALVKMPLLIYIRQFLNLGDNLDTALRKAATMVGVDGFDPNALLPLLKWAREMNALDAGLIAEDLVDEGAAAKELRHKQKESLPVAFLSHSARDKPFIRQLASDLTQNGVVVWLDEQRIMVGESIAEKIGQGLAESDYFLIALSEHSVESQWVKKELNQALVQEVERRNVHILPLKLSDCEIPSLIRDKKYADFTRSYKDGFRDVLEAVKQHRENAK